MLVNQLRDENASKFMHRQQHLLLKFIQFIGVFYFFFGITVGLASSISLIEKKVSTESKEEFLNSISGVFLIMNLLIFFTGIYETISNYKTTESLTRNKMIIYFVLIISLIWSLINLILEIIISVLNISCTCCHRLLIYCSIVLIFISTGFSNINQNISTNETTNKLKCFTFFLKFLAISVSFIIIIINQYLQIFIDLCNKDDFCEIPNNYCNKSQTISNLKKNFGDYLNSSILIYPVFCFVILLKLIFQQFNSIGKENETKLQTLSSINSIYDSQNENQSIESCKNISMIIKSSYRATINKKSGDPSFRLPSASLVQCIVFLSLSFFSLFVLYGIQNTFKKRKLVAVMAFKTLIYIFGVSLTILHISEVSRWPLLLKYHNRFIDRYLIWIGGCGCIFHGIVTVTCSAEILRTTHYDNETNAIYCLLVIAKFASITQTIMQIILMDLANQRKWIQPEINSWSEYLAPAVGMMGLNIGLFILNIVDIFCIDIFYDTPNYIQFLMKISKTIGTTLIFIQRAHGAIFFSSMIIYTHN